MTFAIHHRFNFELSPGWADYVHPEGQRYFVRQGYLRIVTEANVCRQDIMDLVLAWSAHIESLLEHNDLAVTDDVELFLKIEGVDCGYYLVNYATRTQYWMDSYNTEDLGLPTLASHTHLRSIFRIVDRYINAYYVSFQNWHSRNSFGFIESIFRCMLEESLQEHCMTSSLSLHMHKLVRKSCSCHLFVIFKDFQ